MIIDISKLLLTSFVTKLNFYLFKFYRYRIIFCIKKFASYIRIYYYCSYNCFRDIKYLYFLH